jgi:hypothetical protein
VSEVGLIKKLDWRLQLAAILSYQLMEILLAMTDAHHERMKANMEAWVEKMMAWCKEKTAAQKQWRPM